MLLVNELKTVITLNRLNIMICTCVNSFSADINSDPDGRCSLAVVLEDHDSDMRRAQTV